jgi:hypothetical protein
MTDKTGEEPIETPGDPPSDNLPGEIIPTNGTDTIHPNQETETMEVHHHGHVHHEKKWKEYVFQFFMLFLAVFCGFLAEYELEHIIENKKEKQFMASLVRDLEADTVQLNTIRNLRTRNIQQIDSAIYYLADLEVGSIPLSQFNFSLLGLRTFYQNSGTLDQLKNSGGLRLIRKRNVVDSIEAYDLQIKRMVLRDDYETRYLYDHNMIAGKIFDGNILARLHADTAVYHKPSPSLQTPIGINREFLSDYLNSLLRCRIAYAGNLSLQATIKARATRLIETIKKEYHLD